MDSSMDSSGDSTGEAALSVTLAQLYFAFTDADPLAAPRPAAADQAQALADTFAVASAEDRARLLLRALDTAIVAIEVAAGLADAYATDAATTDPEGNSLASAYAAFSASQPAYQALYHYRNALAARLRLSERPLPPAVAAPEAAEEKPPADH